MVAVNDVQELAAALEGAGPRLGPPRHLRAGPLPFVGRVADEVLGEMERAVERWRDGMCGISGILNFDRERPVREEEIHAMRQAARYRGPDDYGVHLDGPAGLGFNRLSIIDLSGGHQPMCNEDGTVWIVFNGEIYNFQELRRDAAGPRPPVPHALGHRDHRPPLGGVRRGFRWRSCAACSRTPSGTRGSGFCSRRGTAWASSRFTITRAATVLPSRRK